MKSLLETNRQASAALCIVLDGDLCKLEELKDVLQRDGLPPMVLVAVSDEKEGRSWVENGASDFVVLPGRREELDCRIRALSRWQSILLDPAHQELRHRESLRKLAHSLKNPLNAVFCYAELLLMDEHLTAAVRKDVEHIITNANVLLETLDSEINFNSEATESQPAGDELS
jgi:signal transduction histidine kinase